MRKRPGRIHPIISETRGPPAMCPHSSGAAFPWVLTVGSHDTLGGASSVSTAEATSGKRRPSCLDNQPKDSRAKSLGQGPLPDGAVDVTEASQGQRAVSPVAGTSGQADEWGMSQLREGQQCPNGGGGPGGLEAGSLCGWLGRVCCLWLVLSGGGAITDHMLTTWTHCCWAGRPWAVPRAVRCVGSTSVHRWGAARGAGPGCS